MQNNPTIELNQVGNTSQGNIKVSGATSAYFIACLNLVVSGESKKVVVNSGTETGAINGTITAS